MSRSKKNYDHLVDFTGNYDDLRKNGPGVGYAAFCSFDARHIEDFWASHNIDSITSDTTGVFDIHFIDSFPSTKYNVVVSCNSGIFRFHHANTHRGYLNLTIRDSNNNPVNDHHITVYCFAPL